MTENFFQKVQFSFLINLSKFIAVINDTSLSGLVDVEAVQHASRGRQEERQEERNDARDILDDHHAKNRPNNPPSQQLLINAARRQLRSTPDADADTNASNVGGGTDDNEDEEGGPSPKRSGRHKPEEANSKTAGHYPACWREAIDRSKEQFRRFVMLYNLFPNRDTHLQDAARILSKVIADERSEGKPFNPSRSFVSITSYSNFSL